MEEVDFTTGQFRVLLNAMLDPQKYTPEQSNLVAELHRFTPVGHKWRVELGEQDIATALTIFVDHQQRVRTPAAQQALQFFVASNNTARRILFERQHKSDVPRETSTEDTA